MSVQDIYLQIHTAIVNFWSMFIGTPQDTFTIILYDLVVYGTQFFIGFLIFYVPWLLLKSLWGR